VAHGPTLWTGGRSSSADRRQRRPIPVARGTCRGERDRGTVGACGRGARQRACRQPIRSLLVGAEGPVVWARRSVGGVRRHSLSRGRARSVLKEVQHRDGQQRRFSQRRTPCRRPRAAGVPRLVARRAPSHGIAGGGALHVRSRRARANPQIQADASLESREKSWQSRSHAVSKVAWPRHAFGLQKVNFAVQKRRA